LTKILSRVGKVIIRTETHIFLKMNGDATTSTGASGLVMNIAPGKKRAQPKAFADDDDEKERNSERSQEIRDLEDGQDKRPKVINMKEQTAWHRGRLGKDSNAEQLIRIHQMGGSASMEPPAASSIVPKQEPVEEDDSHLSVEERARRALVLDAAKVATGAEGEEATLGLKIETGTASSRALRSEEEAYRDDLSRCGAETRLDDYSEMPIHEFGKALMRGMGWKDGDALGGRSALLLSRSPSFLPDSRLASPLSCPCVRALLLIAPLPPLHPFADAAAAASPAVAPTPPTRRPCTAPAPPLRRTCAAPAPHLHRPYTNPAPPLYQSYTNPIPPLHHSIFLIAEHERRAASAWGRLRRWWRLW
jgi:hypothetical protein